MRAEFFIKLSGSRCNDRVRVVMRDAVVRGVMRDAVMRGVMRDARCDA